MDKFVNDHPNWDRCVSYVKTSEQWLQVVNHLFSDGIVHNGRKYILYYFTQCVIRRLGILDGLAIWLAYEKYKRLNTHIL